MPDVPDSQNKPDRTENYPSDFIGKVTIRNGTPVKIRPIRPDDAPRLQTGFSRLSQQSIYLRFLQTFRELSDKQAREFASVDYQHRMALVAEIQEAGETQLIGVARYSMVEDAEPGLAESAIVVVDEYQNLGLGTHLLKCLIQYARSHGVKAFLATVHQTNAQIMRFIQRSGLPFKKKQLEPGVWEVRVSLEKESPGS